MSLCDMPICYTVAMCKSSSRVQLSGNGFKTGVEKL